jgi:tetratricopeptide (TPR) repeat protein
LSTLYAKHCLGRAVGHGRFATALAIVLVLGACSSSGPRVDSEPQATTVGQDAESGRGRASPPPEANLDPIPERVARSYERALAAMQSGEYGEAELELEQLVLEEPGFPGPYVNLSIIYAADGRIDDALAALEQALGIDPGFPAANNQLGRLLREQGRFEEAEAAYQRALATDPGYSIAHYNLGILLDLYLQRPAEALAHYASYQASLPEPDETVTRWIVDLERRSGVSAERVARDQ